MVKSSVSLTAISEPTTPIFPLRTQRTIRYSSTASLTSTAGVPTSYVLIANGAYDPDITGAGHQPMGFDQIMLSYNHYCVLRSRIIATFKNTSAAKSPSVCIRIDPDVTPVTVIDRIIEFGMYKYETLEPSATYGANVTIRESADMRKVQGLGTIVDDPNMRGSVAANPAEGTYYHLMLWDSSTSNVTCNVDYIIEFDCVFLEPRVLPQSLIRTFKTLLMNTETKA